jgi:KipI family sensor histidine kinase inhibitor
MTKIDFDDKRLEVYSIPNGVLLEGNESLVQKLRNLSWDKSYGEIIFGLDSIAVITNNPYAALESIKSILEQSKDKKSKPRQVELPVYYKEDGEDIDFLLSNLKMDFVKLVEIHSNASYQLKMYGFLPGFAYLEGNDQKIQLPRKQNPSKKIHPGSVAISNTYTGIYPVESPGGWHVIGLCPIKLFNPEAQDIIKVEVGSSIRFKPISLSEYNQLYEYG